ncbi:Ig-like domain-containing protein [Geobacillus sp. JS12]|uniref:Ig-like domain-containing protein n=1 Tax=Geobacillus sp. JS12 TaxID=1813182 RepID=UPI0019D2FA78|nr:Ig-like domain-containing protein [Geobacillus sp. JS12]
MSWKTWMVSSFAAVSLAIAGAAESEAYAAKPAKLAIESAQPVNASTVKEYIVKGKGLKGAKIKIVITDGKASVTHDTVVQKSGSFEAPVNVSTLRDGTLTVSVTQIIKGQKHSRVQKKIIKDTKAPSVPVITNKGWINAKQQNAYAVQGTAEPHSAVQVLLSDGKQRITKTVRADGKGRFRAVIDARKLAEGEITVSAVSVDSAGNQSGQSKKVLRKDVSIEAPELLNEGYINAFNYEAYPVTGTGTPGEKVVVEAADGKKSVSASGLVDEDGNYEVEINTSSLKDGKIAIRVKTIDQAGNESRMASVVLIKSLSSPAKPSIDNKGYVNASADATAYEVTGKGEPGAEVEVTLSDGTNEISTVGTVEENGRYHVEADISPLSDGLITITAVQTSVTGNVSPEATATVWKDTAVAAPSLNALPAVTNQNQAAYTIAGTAESNASVQIIITDGQKSLVEWTSADSNGNFSKTIDLSAFHNGQLMIIVTQEDKAQNHSEATTATVTKGQ